MAAVAQGLPAQAAGPDMLTRAQWGAKAPIAKMRRQTPSRILIHHTASRQKPGTSLSAKMASLQRFSQSREKLSDGRMKPAWPDVPYHFYIGANGGIAEGRDISAVGDTNTGYNPAGYIQIVLEGNFESEQPSPAQMAALDRLVRSLMTQYGIAPSGIGSHRQVAQTACPGKNLEALMPDFVASLQAKGG
ncbi:MAG: N-acetylmuramoyl-L-alanine amidase [Notoacmeibacter sp.]|nr:N-acetylmuramoyl-L-alanine amidase [Notoacmeibacter sp.]